MLDTFSKAFPVSVQVRLLKLLRRMLQSRLARLFLPKLKIRGDFNSIKPERKTVLIVSHEGSRTGAPILSYNLMQNLLKKYNVVMYFFLPGPLLDICRASGAIIVGPVQTSELLSGMSLKQITGGARVAGPLLMQGPQLLSGLGIKQITEAVTIEFALINSIQSRHVLPELSRRHVPTVSLIHEFAAYTRPRDAFCEAVFWSGQVVFSTPLTRDNMIAEYPDLGRRAYPVLPQGRCLLPQDGSNGTQEIEAVFHQIRCVMRPENFAADGIVVLGAGFVQLRKGVDLFIECASRILRKAPELAFRFVWVGKGYAPELDTGYSVYLADQVRRAGLEKYVHFMDEVTALDTAYATADILLLSSRLDPLPNVAIDALSIGLPLVCFDKTTGIANILSEYGLGDACVAAYLDTEDMACKVLALAQSKELRTHVAEHAIRMSAEVFDMTKYVTQIEQLALKEAGHLKQVELDIDTIAKSDLLRLDYYHAPHLRHQSMDESIRGYVRSWQSGVRRRKLFPGFHPGIYLEHHGVAEGVDPLADYLRGGHPRGPWNFDLITPAEEAKPLPVKLRIGLHIHAHYPDIFPEILRRLKRNNVCPDLLISVTSESARLAIATYLETYTGGMVDVRVVPNRGRDLGPFLTEFGETICQKYDLIGHLHTKKSADMKDESFSNDWYQFLLENLLGGQASMADIILGRMVDDQNIMMVFPDDPYVVGWGQNFGFGETVLSGLGIKYSYRELCFPMGSMFWARTEGLQTLFDLNLVWEDYPEEPLPYDGSLLHALERLLGILVTHCGGTILLTNVPGKTH